MELRDTKQTAKGTQLHYSDTESEFTDPESVLSILKSSA